MWSRSMVCYVCVCNAGSVSIFYPVPVHKIHVSVGERVELPCDVTTSVANWDETPPDAARSSPYPHDSLRDSGRKANGRSASSAGRNRIRHHNYESDWHDHDDDDAANNGGNNDGQEEEKDEEGAYLVLWFIDPDRKPIYRFPFSLIFLFYLFISILLGHGIIQLCFID